MEPWLWCDLLKTALKTVFFFLQLKNESWLMPYKVVLTSGSLNGMPYA